MKSFLLRKKKPTIKWGMLPDGVMFKGQVPEGFQLAICPTPGYIIVDIDRHGEISGFDNVPLAIMDELSKTLNYPTKNNGKHYWLRYTGTAELSNKASGLGVDLRTHKGYVVWYPEESIEERFDEIIDTSPILNAWLKHTFSYT